MNPPLFSIVIIAKNEELTLPRLLESLSEFRARNGEVIMVDTGSNDQTIQVAHRYKCRVCEAGDRFVTTIDESIARALNHEYIVDPKVDGETDLIKAGDQFFDFSSARNFAAELSTNDIMIMPDCDEVFTRLDIDAINEHIRAHADRFEFNYVVAHQEDKPLLKFYGSKFYDRRKFVWKCAVHEGLYPRDGQTGALKVIKLEEPFILLEHFQNEASDRSPYLLGLAYDCWNNNNTHDRKSHYLGRELMYRRKFRSSIKELTRHVGMNGWLPERALSMLFIGHCHLYLGETEKMINAYGRAFDLYASREPLLALAQYYYQKGDHQRTACFAEASLAVPRPKENHYSMIETNYTYYPHELLYWAYWYLGMKEKSREHFKKCIEYAPAHKKFLDERHLFEGS